MTRSEWNVLFKKELLRILNEYPKVKEEFLCFDDILYWAEGYAKNLTNLIGDGDISDYYLKNIKHYIDSSGKLRIRFNTARRVNDEEE